MKNLAKTLVLLAAMVVISPALHAQISVGLSVRLAPPPLPVYAQPECPVDGYLWQPGYWAYDDGDGYYWVPGVWVAPPDAGLLWTPNYWGYDNGVYLYHPGYWGSHVGFYGGIDYGYGYPGVGFVGGGWSGRSFRYNTAVFNVNRTIVHNTYIDRTVVHTNGGSRASFNGPGGINRQPRPEERRAMSEHHIQPTHSQISHQQAAGRNPAQHFATNHGRPATPAVNRVNATNHSVGQRANPAAMHNAEGRQPNAIHEANRNHEPNNGAMTHQQQHIQPQQHAEQQHMQQQPQQHREQQQHMQPQQHTQQPQQHMEQQQHMQQQPQQHMEQPHMQQQPQQHMGGGEPHGGGGEPHGGGGGEHGHRP